MASMHDDIVSTVPVSRRPCGIRTFCVEGVLDGEYVHAEWDGRWLVASPALLVRASLAMAVDDALAEAGFSQSYIYAVGTSPEHYLRAMVECCETVEAAEYTLRGRRKRAA
jgi:hypothetical protein